jgi:hypothetical protein
MRQAHDCTQSIDPARFQAERFGQAERRAVLAAVKIKPLSAVAFGQS